MASNLEPHKQVYGHLNQVPKHAPDDLISAEALVKITSRHDSLVLDILVGTFMMEPKSYTSQPSADGVYQNLGPQYIL